MWSGAACEGEESRKVDEGDKVIHGGGDNGESRGKMRERAREEVERGCASALGERGYRNCGELEISLALQSA